MKTLNFNHAGLSKEDYLNSRYEVKCNIHWSLIFLMSCLFVLIIIFSAVAGNGKEAKPAVTFQFQNAVDATVAPNKSVYVTGFKNLIGNNTEIITQQYTSDGVLVNEVSNIGNVRELYNDQPFKIMSDAYSNIYVCGHEYIDSIYGYEVVLIKYNAKLALQWKYVFYNSAHFNDQARGIAFDGEGNICIAGMQHENPMRSKVFIYKINADGELVYSTNLIDDNENKIQNVNGLIADTDGNVYICGMALNKVKATRFYTAKFDAAGQLKWKRFNDCVSDKYNDEANALTFDSYGNIIVTGTSEMDLKTTVPMVVKYNVDGLLTWCKHFTNHAYGRESGSKIVADNAGNVYVSSHYSTAKISAEHFTLFKIDSWGSQLWARNIEGSFEDVKINRDSVIYIAGSVGVNTAVVYTIGTRTGSKLSTTKYVPLKSLENEKTSATFLALAFNLTGDVVIACGKTELCGETYYCESNWLVQCYSSKCTGFNKNLNRIKITQKQ